MGITGAFRIALCLSILDEVLFCEDHNKRHDPKEEFY
jgi:hypothetical protein